MRGGKPKRPSKVNWDLLERRIASSEKAYQRQIIRRKIDELVQYYEQCRQARDLPSIPGAVIISCDEKLTFQPIAETGRRRPAQGPGARRHPARDRRPAPAARAARRHRQSWARIFTVPAIIFDRLPEDHIVQMFVTINAKHTRLNASHLVTCRAGSSIATTRSRAHDVVAR